MTLLRPFFELCFSTQFVQSRPEWIALALEMIEENRDAIASDLDGKSLQAEGAIQERLAEVIEVDTTVLGAVLYRIGHGIFRRDPCHPALPYFARLMKSRTAMEIASSAEIGPRLVIMHGFGVFVGPHHRIGSHFTIYQGATLGQGGSLSSANRIVVGDHCVVFAGGKVMEGVTVGDHVSIAANAVLTRDAESNATYAGIPAVKVSH